METKRRGEFIKVLLEEWNKGTGAVHSRVLEERSKLSHADIDAMLMLLTIQGLIDSHYQPDNARVIIVTRADTDSLSQIG